MGILSAKAKAKANSNRNQNQNDRFRFHGWFNLRFAQKMAPLCLNTSGICSLLIKVCWSNFVVIWGKKWPHYASIFKSIRSLIEVCFVLRKKWPHDTQFWTRFELIEQKWNSKRKRGEKSCFEIHRWNSIRCRFGVRFSFGVRLTFGVRFLRSFGVWRSVRRAAEILLFICEMGGGG